MYFRLSNYFLSLIINYQLLLNILTTIPIRLLFNFRIINYLLITSILKVLVNDQLLPITQLLIRLLTKSYQHYKHIIDIYFPICELQFIFTF